MDTLFTESTLRRLVETFGVERLVTALPQREVRQALDLVTIQELADSLGMTYDLLHAHLINGDIPYPSVRLRRRGYYTREQAEQIRQRWNAGEN